MKYPLEDLLRVRRFRVDEAQSQVTALKAAVASAEENLHRSQQELQDYIAHRESREAELYNEIMLQQVSMKDLDDLKLSIATLREKQGHYEEAVVAARKNLESVEAQLAEAREALATADKECRKINEHKELWAQEELKRCEKEEEKELEDFRVRLGDE